MGDKVVWESVKWPDGSRYEGLVKDDRCHIRGVFNYADGDKYMGEYVDNNMEGYGVYVWQSGSIYRGQWANSMMHGCGVKISKQPNNQYLAEEGQFINDDWVGATNVCSVADARKAAAKADTNAQMAMVFELHHKHQSNTDGSTASSSSHSSNSSRGSGDVVRDIKMKMDSFVHGIQLTVKKMTDKK